MSSFRNTDKKKKKKKKKSKTEHGRRKSKGKSTVEVLRSEDRQEKRNNRKKQIEDALKEFTSQSQLIDPDNFDTDFQDGTSVSVEVLKNRVGNRSIDQEEFVPSGRLNLRGGIEIDDDEKYSGKAITRNELTRAIDGQANDYINDDMQKRINSAYLQRGLQIQFDAGDEHNESDIHSSVHSETDPSDNEKEFDGVNNGIDFSKRMKQIEDEDRKALMTLTASREGDIVRATHTKNQLGLYDDFLRLRISMQSLLSCANRLPQPEAYALFKEEKIVGGRSTRIGLDSNLDLLLETLTGLIHLQSGLIDRNSSVKSSIDADRTREKKLDGALSEGNYSDDRISKMWKEIDIVNRDIYAHDRRVVQKWDEKIRLQSSTNQKALKAVNRTVLSQIDALMADKDKIVERTRMHPTPVKVIGKRPQTKIDKGNSALYDEEVYDDNDFYQMQLKEFISSSAINDLERTNLETKLSFKSKKTQRKVDTKASKGRRLKFTPHSKLLNFMAPIEQHFSAVDASCLIGSLFEQIPDPSNDASGESKLML